MSVLDRIYASAPADPIIQTLEVKPSGADPIRVCIGFEDQALTLEDETVATFIAGPLEVSRPRINTSGQQTLRFAIANVTGVAQEAVEQALESGDQVPVIYREYLASDKSAPAKRPLPMVMVGGQFEGLMLQIEASYYDLLNTAWPRKRYTAEIAPGLKYL